ncbi:hypothetical protein OSB04_un000703 [Centaurea solstitialis]|uniref:Uncharacterized protein n=1 Tax=Centaurea solstitialis TaxID=347529 RepID=A0AA38SGX1_9ASTR|nr:hypothetical protein OSB04_un000703 [Centaurea solstitialis]
MAIKKPTPKLLEAEIEDLDMEASESEDPETDSESEGDDEDEDVRLTEPSKTSIYNKDGILDKLGDISWPQPQDMEWIHKLSLDINQEQEVDVNDDLNRELAFRAQASEATRQAFGKFETMGLPFLCPSDYCAEMVKTDSHMEKIKGRLLVEKRRIEEGEERRKARDNKKKAKEVQAHKQKERVKQKKDEIESVKKWRKQRQQSGFAGGEKEGGDMGLPFADGKESQRYSTKNKRPGVSPWDRSGGKAKAGGGKDRKGGNGNGKRKSREFKDSKYGFGGKKGMKKQNTAETTNDFKGFNKSDSFQNKKRKK